MTESSLPSEPAGSRTIVLWGSSQVGKTTTLAAYLGHSPASWIDPRDQPSLETKHKFLEIWNKLKSNQLVGGTQGANYFELRHVDGFLVKFRDMRGGNTSISGVSTEDSRALAEADAVILFVEWPGGATENRLRPANDALHLLARSCPKALVITKCEGFLSSQEMGKFTEDPFKFIQNHPGRVPRLLEELLHAFRAHHDLPGGICPVTVYGWNGGQPAVLLDEFGRMVPWNIHPVAVATPFDYILKILQECD